MTTYIVLRKTTDEQPYWLLVGQAEAHGPQQAVRRITSEAGEFLAVPVRNATFISQGEEPQAPKVTSVVLHPDQYLDGQRALPLDENDDEDALPDPEPAPLDPEPEPVPA